jgi:DNA-binding NtrC family response regulator
MTVAAAQLLLVEDDNAMREMLESLFRQEGYLVSEASSASAALDLVRQTDFDVVLSDIKMPGKSGLELVGELRELRPDTPVVLMTAFGSIDTAVDAMRAGAFGYTTKPFQPEEVLRTVKRALDRRSVEDANRKLRCVVGAPHFQELIGDSPSMRNVFTVIRRAAQVDASVLITGESGTGKEVVARTLHHHGRRAHKPFLPINCTAIPEGLLESELFGHVRGAFTGAIATRRGLFERADGGTLFLDEIGDINLEVQTKLLRVLQEMSFERVGSSQPITVDVRILAATHQDLEALIRAGRFREDLFYRLNVVKIDMPPLRERAEDIPLLAQHFVEKYARPGEPPRQVSPQAMEVLLQCRWSGNIRQLENAIERACVTSRDGVIRPEDLPPELTAPQAAKLPFNIDLERPLPDLLRDITMEVEQQYIRKALKKSHGNIGRCARICGLSRRSISAKIAEYKINKTVFKEA